MIQTSKISVINHNHESIIYFKEETPNPNLSSKIIFRSGENDFDPPLIDAHKLCTSSKSKYDKFVLYFMSDGAWSFPEKGIQNLVSDKSIIDKIDFHTCAFGPGANK